MNGAGCRLSFPVSARNMSTLGEDFLSIDRFCGVWRGAQWLPHSLGALMIENPKLYGRKLLRGSRATGGRTGPGRSSRKREGSTSSRRAHPGLIHVPADGVRSVPMSEPAPAGDLRETFGFGRVARWSWLLHRRLARSFVIDRSFELAPAGDQVTTQCSLRQKIG